MIKYNLKCNNDHEFESWFADSNEFDNLRMKNLLDCIYCSSKNIKKSIMSPMITNGKKNNNVNVFTKNEKKKLLEIKEYIEKNFEYVGKNFSYEARSLIYDTKNNEKGIYGKATKEEIEELNDEGIKADIIPWVNEKEN